MLQIRKILLRGPNVDDALIRFESGANVLAGESDTGKSFLVQCIDFILGAEKLKLLKEAKSYKHLFVEFENSNNEYLTLVRGTEGGKLKAYRSPIKEILGDGEVIDPKRTGKSIRPDVTSAIFPFGGIPDAQLRKNVNGKTQRLTIRTLAPFFLIDEVTIIDEYSPILGRPGYDKTALKRAFSYALTGVDDKDVVAAETNEVAKTRLKAKLEVIVDLLLPLEEKYRNIIPPSFGFGEELVEQNIDKVTTFLDTFGQLQATAQQRVQELTKLRLKSDSQLLGIGELRTRYALLNERYESDLQRLDFIAEGSHYIDALQDVSCPLCDQMLPGHAHSKTTASLVQESAIAEAAKIKSHRRDLAAAIYDIDAKKNTVSLERFTTELEMETLQKQLEVDITPQLKDAMGLYERLVKIQSDQKVRRVEREHWLDLQKVRSDLESEIAISAEPKQTWDGISSFVLREFCKEIEVVLKEWAWSANPRVEFDEKEYDIIVDGQPRNSHGKGVRAILYSAFTIGLLRYCATKRLPHFGVVVVDSPLTSFKKRAAKVIPGDNGEISADIEAAFWNSLKYVSNDVQIIVIENKEPPTNVADMVHYEWFAGISAINGERAGLIPKNRKNIET